MPSYISNPRPKAEQHVRCCVAVGIAHDIASRIPDCVASTPIGAKAASMLPLINDATKGLHNSNMKESAWERVRRCFAIAAPKTAFHEDWPPELQKATWAAQVFLAEAMWYDATIAAPVWFGYPLRQKHLTRLIRNLFDSLSDDLCEIYGDTGPAEVGTDIYMEISALCSKRIR